MSPRSRRASPYREAGSSRCPAPAPTIGARWGQRARFWSHLKSQGTGVAFADIAARETVRLAQRWLWPWFPGVLPAAGRLAVASPYRRGNMAGSSDAFLMGMFSGSMLVSLSSASTQPLRWAHQSTESPGQDLELRALHFFFDSAKTCERIGCRSSASHLATSLSSVGINPTSASL